MREHDRVQPHREVEHREERQQRDRKHDVGNDHRREDQRLERRSPAPPHLDADGQQRTEQRGDGGRGDRDDQRVQRGRQDVVLLASETYHLSGNAGPHGRQAALVEGERDQHGDRHVEEGEDQHEDVVPLRLAAAPRSAITRPP